MFVVLLLTILFKVNLGIYSSLRSGLTDSAVSAVWSFVQPLPRALRLWPSTIPSSPSTTWSTCSSTTPPTDDSKVRYSISLWLCSLFLVVYCCPGGSCSRYGPLIKNMPLFNYPKPSQASDLFINSLFRKF